MLKPWLSVLPGERKAPCIEKPCALPGRVKDYTDGTDFIPSTADAGGKNEFDWLELDTRTLGWMG